MVDLHIHSNYSDGQLSIEEIIQEAEKCNVKTISITDHDNIDSTQKLLQYKNANDIILIPGVELSSENYFFGSKMKVHILGYNYDYNNKGLNNALSNIYSQRACDNEIYVRNLIKKIHFLSPDMFQNFKYGKYGWIRQLVLKQVSPFINSDNEIQLKSYMENVKPIYHRYNFKVEEAIEIILKAGGYPILAHPFKLHLENNQLDTFINYLINCGLDGVESYHKEAKLSEIEFYKTLANKYRLNESGGSDFHSFFYDNGLGTNIEELNENLPFVKKLVLERKLNGGGYSGEK